jgi:anti-sigma B factor antagonist
MNELAQIEIDQSRDVVVARVLGEIDISNVGTVKRELTDSVPNTALGLVVDLSHAAHLDSSGIYLLFQLANALESRQQRICVVAPPTAPSSRVLFITGFDKLMCVTGTVSEAIALLSRGGG